MTETYSLAVKGQLAEATPSPVNNVLIGDSAARSPGAQQYAMWQGNQILCKNPDGSLQWYTFDAERSTPANPVLRPVGP